MSSSETRIIKYAKISSEPVVIAMQEFRELDVSGLDSADGPDDLGEVGQDVADGVFESEPAEIAVPMDEAILQAAREEAQAILDSAQTILDSAQAEAVRVRDQAAEEGRKQGHEAGLNQGKSDGLKQGLDEAKNQMATELRQAADQANAIITAAGEEAGQILAEAEPKIIELVLAISRKIIYDEAAERPDVVLNLVRSALKRVKDQDKINIHVSPDDYEQVLTSRRDLQGLVGAEKSLAITADPVMGRGGCLIETSFGTVEASIDAQFESIRRVLQELLP